jgi:hypothetical protein
MATDCPFATLGLAPGADPENITSAFRRAARATHPDHGGDARAFERVMSAMDELRRNGALTVRSVSADTTAPSVVVDLTDRTVARSSSTESTSLPLHPADAHGRTSDTVGIEALLAERLATIAGLASSLRAHPTRRNPYAAMMDSLDRAAGLDPLPVTARRRPTRSAQRFASVLQQHLSTI